VQANPSLPQPRAFYVNFKQNASAPHFPPPLRLCNADQQDDAAAAGPNRLVASTHRCITDTVLYCIYHKQTVFFF
jgi:hypothetical protein